MTKDVTLRASLMVAGGGYVIRGTNSFPVTSRAAVVYAHKNETIDVITSKVLTLRHVLVTYLIKCDTAIPTYGATLKVQTITIICTSTTLYELHYQTFNKTAHLREAVIL